MKTIKYYTKNVYGREMIYLADEREALLWQAITGQKTIDQRQLTQLTSMTGVKFERVFEPVAVA